MNGWNHTYEATVEFPVPGKGSELARVWASITFLLRLETVLLAYTRVPNQRPNPTRGVGAEPRSQSKPICRSAIQLPGPPYSSCI